MHFLDALAERRIAEAIAAGDFDHLPGEGKPLDLDDDALVPEELRVAHRILKNAGFLPPEVEARREVTELTELLRHATDEPSKRRAVARLALLGAKLEAEGRALTTDSGYDERIVERLGR
jgi:hypothetical protein